MLGLIVGATLFLTSLASVASAQTTEFVLGASNSVPMGYVPAVLADVQSSEDFMTEYTSFGISLPDGGYSVSNPQVGCGYVAVQEGLLATGAFLDRRYVTVYFENGTEQSGNGAFTIQGPQVFFGLTNPNKFLGSTWTKSFGSSFYTTTKEGCSVNDGDAWVLYRRAEFVVAEYSPDNTSPAGSNGILVSAAELRSSDHFATWYNSVGGSGSSSRKPAGAGLGLPVYSGSTGTLNNFCCVFQLSTGYLSLGTSSSLATPIQPYNAANQANLCPFGSYGSDSFSGTVAFGLEGSAYIGSLNFTTRNNFVQVGGSQLPSQCLSNNAARTLGIYKVHNLPTPVTPSPGPLTTATRWVSR